MDKQMLKTYDSGLVLEGGAMRGMFTVGVTDVLLEQGISFKGMIGVSAGAAFGCNFKSQQVGRAIRYNKRYCGDKRFCSLRSWLKTGDLFGAEFCYHEIPEKLDLFDRETFDNSPMAFYVVCTDVESGQAVYKRCDRADREGMAWIRASASMPLVSRPVELDGRRYLDGGIADSIPLRRFEELGYEKNVVILTQPADFVKEKSRQLPLLRLALGKYPRLIQAMAHRHQVYNESLAYVRRQEAAGKAFVLQPEGPLPVGRVERDPARLQAVYELGRAVGEKRLPALLAFLENGGENE